MRLLDRPPAADPATSAAPYRIYNIGNRHPVLLMRYIEVLEKALGKTAVKEFLPRQAGDMDSTWADTSELESRTEFSPSVSIEAGIERFVAWYREYYKV